MTGTYAELKNSIYSKLNEKQISFMNELEQNPYMCFFLMETGECEYALYKEKPNETMIFELGKQFAKHNSNWMDYRMFLVDHRVDEEQAVKMVVCILDTLKD